MSKILVKKKGSVTRLSFEDDANMCQTEMDTNKPHRLLFSVYQIMIKKSFEHNPNQKNTLIIGLGGGSMVQHLNKYHPKIAIDVVEISPAMVRVAKTHFGLREDQAQVYVEDGVDFIKNTQNTYDSIYLDAFGPEGAPPQMSTTAFLRNIKERLSPGGVAIFNITDNMKIGPKIKSVFPRVFEFRVPWKAQAVFVALASSPESGLGFWGTNKKPPYAVLIVVLILIGLIKMASIKF